MMSVVGGLCAFGAAAPAPIAAQGNGRGGVSTVRPLMHTHSLLTAVWPVSNHLSP